MDASLEESVRQEIKDWSKHALEEPNDMFKGLPACPYAQKAWEDNRVGFSFLYEKNSQTLTTLISRFDDSYDVVILIDFDFEEDAEEFHESLERINMAISEGVFIQKDVWVMGFHPYDDPNELIDDNTFSASVNEPYSMIFVQRLSKLQESSDKIKKLGYYKIYLEQYDVSQMLKKRQETYRRLQNGNG